MRQDHLTKPPRKSLRPTIFISSMGIAMQHRDSSLFPATGNTPVKSGIPTTHADHSLSCSRLEDRGQTQGIVLDNRLLQGGIMKVMKVHLDFWQEKKCLPGWGREILDRQKKWFPYIPRISSVHRLIPRGDSFDKAFHIQNLLTSLKSARHRTGSVFNSLQNLSVSQNAGKREQHLCQKWLLRIKQEDMKS